MHYKHGAYYRVSRNRWQPLGKVYNNALRRYAELEAPSSSWKDLVDLTYQDIYADHEKGELAAGTVKQYEGIRARITKGLGDFEPHEITQPHVRQLLEMYRNTPNARNRTLTVLRKVFEKGCNVGACDFNPAYGVPRLDERKRDRLMEMGEFMAIRSKANAQTQLIMDMCYLTAQRIGDVLSLTHSQIKPEGVHFKQQKTGKRLMVDMTPELAGTIKSAKALRKVMCPYLFHPKGKTTPYSYRTIRDAYERARVASKVAHCTLHDIRAMALTHVDQAGGDATALAGHHSRATTEGYIRDKRTTHVFGPTLRQSMDIDAENG
jgi:integrase